MLIHRVYGGIFITEIFVNFYTKRGGEFLTSRTGIPDGPARKKSNLKTDNSTHCIR